MINWTLYKREMKNSVRLLIIFAAIITLYVSIIIRMYDPLMVETLEGFAELMPELMASVGMRTGATSLLDFMISYLYGFILLIFPMIFSILRGNGLIAKYIDKGSMFSLVAAPVKRQTIALTQMKVLMSGIFILISYVTILELLIAHVSFPGELIIAELLNLNLGLLCLHWFIAGICFLTSCIFSDAKYSIAFGAGIPTFMYVMQMLANMGGSAEKAKYFSLFTLYNPMQLVAGENNAITGIVILFLGSIIISVFGVIVFSKKGLTYLNHANTGYVNCKSKVIMYTFNGFCKVVIRYAAINAWRERADGDKGKYPLNISQKKKFYPFSMSDEYFAAPYKEYHITICGQTIILTNGNLAAALLSLPEKKREVIYLYFFGQYTQREIGENTEAAGVQHGIIYPVPCRCYRKKWRCFHMGKPNLVPYETIIRTTSGEPEAVDEILQHYRQSGEGIHKGANLEAVWSMESDSCQSNVANVICNLRKKIEPDSQNPTYIKTVLGMGYKFASGE